MWSTRSAASMYDVDFDERRLMLGRRGMAPSQYRVCRVLFAVSRFGGVHSVS
ncbi:hypothetical protein GCM10009789_87640 [Kribbella sancticallisti]|uniref:DUF4158 domain-containing protein n=1 Tax=Kribbella sancticallisti TaxID=460087 RepID=A0ABN2EWV6_9ACTN